MGSLTVALEICCNFSIVLYEDILELGKTPGCQKRDKFGKLI